MATLGFLPENITPEKPDYALFEELWKMLDGEKFEGVEKDDFSYILQVIRGSRFPEREVEADPDDQKKGIDKQLVFNE